MRSGTEKNPNPHEVSLGKFLRGLERPVSADEYRRLPTGQIVRLIHGGY